MSRSILIVMGGSKLEDAEYADEMAGFGAVYVETEGMRLNFEAMGLDNVRLFPNCRKRPATPVVPSSRPGRLSCVYFSQISKEKGGLLVPEIARLLPEVDFHMYGSISSDISGRFRTVCSGLNNVIYHGVFDSVSGDVITELSKYDIHLFPTECPSEGVPGVLVETKIAAVPTIASNRCFNSEIVQDGQAGFVVNDVSAESFAMMVDKLDSDRNLLFRMKLGALKSAETYYLDCYLPDIVSILRGGS